MKKLDLVPCPYVNDQYIQTTELLCDIQECNTCPIRFRYDQLEFKETLTLGKEKVM